MNVTHFAIVLCCSLLDFDITKIVSLKKGALRDHLTLSIFVCNLRSKQYILPKNWNLLKLRQTLYWSYFIHADHKYEHRFWKFVIKVVTKMAKNMAEMTKIKNCLESSQKLYWPYFKYSDQTYEYKFWKFVIKMIQMPQNMAQNMAQMKKIEIA